MIPAFPSLPEFVLGLLTVLGYAGAVALFVGALALILIFVLVVVELFP